MDDGQKQIDTKKERNGQRVVRQSPKSGISEGYRVRVQQNKQ